MVLLLNPAKGIAKSKKKDKHYGPACDELYKTLDVLLVDDFREYSESICFDDIVVTLLDVLAQT